MVPRGPRWSASCLGSCDTSRGRFSLTSQVQNDLGRMLGGGAPLQVLKLEGVGLGGTACCEYRAAVRNGEGGTDNGGMSASMTNGRVQQPSAHPMDQMEDRRQRNSLCLPQTSISTLLLGQV